MNDNLYTLLKEFRNNPEIIEIKDDISIEMNAFWNQKKIHLDEILKLNNILNSIPEHHFVVDRLLVYIKINDDKKIEYFKNKFIEKYAEFETDENYEKLIFLIIFLEILPEIYRFEIIIKIIDKYENRKINKAYIPFLNGIFNLYKKNYDTAIDHFINATFIDNNFWLAFQYIANIYYDLKEFRIAIGYYKKLFEYIAKIESDQLAFLFFCISYCIVAIKDYKNAVTYLKDCLKIDPKMRYANNLIGYCLSKLKKYDEAIRFLDISIQIEPEGVYHYWNIVSIYKQTGNFDKALEILEFLKSKTKSQKLIEKEFDSINKLINKHNYKNTIVSIEEELEIEEELSNIVIPQPKQKLKEISDTQLETEKILEDLLEKRLLNKKITFGKTLNIYNDDFYGRQYRTNKGRMDLLTRDMDDDSLVVIELKRGKSDLEVVDQIMDYINWTKINLAKPDQKVKGIICIKQGTDRLKSLVRSLTDIELYEYEFEFIKIE